MQDNTTPYTYLIGWSSHNKWYYGRRTRKGCHPEELWVKYFTSSKHVKSFAKQHGKPDIIQIRRVFNNSKKCADWETKVLRRVLKKSSHLYLNLSVSGSYDCTNKVAACDTEGNSIGLIELNDPRWKTGEIVHPLKGIPKPHFIGKPPWNKGLTKETDSRVRQTSEKLTGREGRPASEKQKAIVSAYWKGRKRGPRTPEHNRKLKEAVPTSPTKGTKWMINRELKIKKRVPVDKVQEFLALGWEISFPREKP